VYTPTPTPAPAPGPRHTHCAYRGSSTRRLVPNCLSFFFALIHSLLAPSTHSAPPTLHHGLAQHIQQRPQPHAELPERRQRSAAIRRAGQLANIWPVGRLRRGCPTSQRISRRRGKRERVESTEHWRYVAPQTGTSTTILSADSGHPLEALAAVPRTFPDPLWAPACRRLEYGPRVYSKRC
jgi:hypothetical protein